MKEKHWKLLYWADMIVGCIGLIRVIPACLLIAVSPKLFKPVTFSIYGAALLSIFLSSLLLASGILLFKKKEKFKKQRMKLKMLSILDIAAGFLIIIAVVNDLISTPTIASHFEFMIACIFETFYYLLLFISGFVLEELEFYGKK